MYPDAGVLGAALYAFSQSAEKRFPAADKDSNTKNPVCVWSIFVKQAIVL